MNDFLYCDYDDLDTSDRIAACAQARDAAETWEHRIDESPWTGLDNDDPRRIAFERAFLKLHPRALESVELATGHKYQIAE